MEINKKLEKEFNYYLDHQEELIKQYAGKYLVIKDQKVFGAFDTEIIAYQEALKELELGTFLIQLCTIGSDNYSQSFNSRVVYI
ncbi:MAG: hypothetical protein IPJ03_20120 [Ignavibacteriales bacterium]|nr:hypothetical protein [Ignavibacteriales bacterium]